MISGQNTGMEDVTHKQIYDRLIEVEKKVDEIDRNTVKVVEAFDSVKGRIHGVGMDSLCRKTDSVDRCGVHRALCCV
jgi:hypothetical protein